MVGLGDDDVVRTRKAPQAPSPGEVKSKIVKAPPDEALPAALRCPYPPDVNSIDAVPGRKRRCCSFVILPAGDDRDAKASSREREGKIGRLYPYFFTTTGNGTSLENARKFGQEIARALIADGVQAVILTAT